MMAKRRRGRPTKPGPRTPSGQLSRARPQTRAEREAAMQTVLEVRARLAGLPLKPETVATLRQPWMGCRAGRVISSEPDNAELWQAICDIRRVRRAYCAAIGMTDEAKLQQALKPNSEFPPDAEPVDSPSSLPEDERHRHAVAAWDDLSARIYAVHPMAVRYVLAVVVRDEETHGEMRLADVLRKAFDINSPRE